VYCVSKTPPNKPDRKATRRIIVRWSNPIAGDPLYIPSCNLIRELDQENADVIHIHNVHTLLPATIGVLRRRFSGVIVLQPHYHGHGQNILRNLFFSVYKNVLNTTVLRRFNAVITNSEYESRTFKKDFHDISAKVVLVPEEYSIALPLGVKWDPSSRPRRILYVGALTKYKNVGILIQAFKILASTRKDLELVIIGDGPEKEKLAELALKLGVQEMIEWNKSLPLNELLLEYAKASVLVMLSSLESFSRVTYEAMTIGVPIIVYNYGALSALVEKRLARGVDCLDPEEVASAINNTLYGDSKPLSPLPAFGDEMYAKTMVKVYETVMRQSL
jgi:glycosyltransferase involved in cell wall biosynthesis